MCFEWDAPPPLVDLSIEWSVAGVNPFVPVLRMPQVGQCPTDQPLLLCL
jgi:hypothetical protein